MIKNLKNIKFEVERYLCHSTFFYRVACKSYDPNNPRNLVYKNVEFYVSIAHEDFIKKALEFEAKEFCGNFLFINKDNADKFLDYINSLLIIDKLIGE